jgi:hypothetical protein
MIVMILWQVSMWVILERFLTAGRAEVIGLTCMFALELGGLGLNFHFADRINSNTH